MRLYAAVGIMHMLLVRFVDDGGRSRGAARPHVLSSWAVGATELAGLSSACCCVGALHRVVASVWMGLLYGSRRDTSCFGGSLCTSSSGTA